MRWQCLQHVSFEGPGFLADWAQNRKHVLDRTEMWTGSALPLLSDLDGLVVLGGPMNVYQEDRHPWLRAEKAFIRKVADSKKPVLGVCLGAQLISVALGGTVDRNPHAEIGWFPVELRAEARESGLFRNFPDRFMAFHWHRDRFTIPPGAIHTAFTEACAEQAFVYEARVVGLQFHLESTASSIAALLTHCGDEIMDSPTVQESFTIGMGFGHLPGTHALLADLLDTLATQI